MKAKKSHRIFSVVRERKESGKDKAGDLFFIHAKGNPESEGTYITGISGSIGARQEAQRLVDLLNTAVDEFHKG